MSSSEAREGPLISTKPGKVKCTQNCSVHPARTDKCLALLSAGVKRNCAGNLVSKGTHGSGRHCELLHCGSQSSHSTCGSSPPMVTWSISLVFQPEFAFSLRNEVLQSLTRESYWGNLEGNVIYSAAIHGNYLEIPKYPQNIEKLFSGWLQIDSQMCCEVN